MTIVDAIREFMLGASVPASVPAEPVAPQGYVPRRITPQEHARLAALWVDGKAPQPAPLWVPPEPANLPRLWCPFCHRVVEIMTEDEAERVEAAARQRWEP